MISPITSDDTSATGTREETAGVSEETRTRKRRKRPLMSVLRNDVKILLTYVGHYLAARSDAIGVKFRRALVWAAVGVIALFGAAAAVITAIVLLFQGIAEGLSVLFGNRFWAGDLTAGAGFLLLLALAIFAGMTYLRKNSYRQTKDKYERRRKDEYVLHRRSETDASRTER